MKLEEKVKNIAKAGFFLVLSAIAAASCEKKEKVFAYISEGPPAKGKIENPAMPYYIKALEFKRQGQLDSALLYSQKVIDNRNIMESESLATMHVCRAEIFQQLKQYKDAINSYEEAIYYCFARKKFNNATAIILELADLYDKIGDKEKVKECKKRAWMFKEYGNRFEQDN